MNELIEKVRQWGRDRDILGQNKQSTPEAQYKKLLEEINEIGEGLENNNHIDIVDGIGDSAVVLIMLADLAGTSFEECLQHAYNQIKDRKGKMINGIFHKEV